MITTGHAHANLLCRYYQHENSITFRSFLVPTAVDDEYLEIDMQCLLDTYKLVEHESARWDWWLEHLVRQDEAPPCCEVLCPGLGLEFVSCYKDIRFQTGVGLMERREQRIDKYQWRNTNLVHKLFLMQLTQLEGLDMPIQRAWCRSTGLMRVNPRHNPQSYHLLRGYPPPTGNYNPAIFGDLFFLNDRQDLPPTLVRSLENHDVDPMLPGILEALPLSTTHSFFDASTPYGQVELAASRRGRRIIRMDDAQWVAERAAANLHQQRKRKAGCFDHLARNAHDIYKAIRGPNRTMTDYSRLRSDLDSESQPPAYSR